MLFLSLFHFFIKIIFKRHYLLGFDNLYDLHHLRLLRLSNGKFIDDWTMSRIGGMFGESLEFLDLSHCKRISAKGTRFNPLTIKKLQIFYKINFLLFLGLMGLRNMSKLRYLRLEGLNHVENIAKSALLLEEAIPDLTVVGLDFDHALDKLEAENRLLQDDRVLIDARGFFVKTLK